MIANLVKEKVTIHRFNDTTNEVFDQYDTILSIDDVN